MGSTDAVPYARQVAGEVMKPVLVKRVHVWLDDVLGYASSDAQVLDILDFVLQRCTTYGVKLSPEKCTFIAYSTIWCGKKF